MHQTNNARFLDLLWRHVLSICLVTVALLVSYSRYGAIVCLMLSYTPVAFNSQQTCPSLSRVSDAILNDCTVQWESFVEVAALPWAPSNNETKVLRVWCFTDAFMKPEISWACAQLPAGSIAMLQPHCLALFAALIMKALHHGLAHQHLQHVGCYSRSNCLFCLSISYRHL